jgi:hypothetical protein
VSAGLTVFLLRGFQNGSVNVNPNARGRVLHALGEFQRSEALMCVLHNVFSSREFTET